MLAVVQDHQHLTRTDLVEQPGRGCRHARQRKHPGDRTDETRRVGERRELHQPRAVGRITRQLLRDRQRQAALPDTTRARDRDQAVRTRELHDPHGVDLTPDQVVEDRKVGGHRAD